MSKVVLLLNITFFMEELIYVSFFYTELRNVVVHFIGRILPYTVPALLLIINCIIILMHIYTIHFVLSLMCLSYPLNMLLYNIAE